MLHLKKCKRERERKKVKVGARAGKRARWRKSRVRGGGRRGRVRGPGGKEFKFVTRDKSYCLL